MIKKSFEDFLDLIVCNRGVILFEEGVFNVNGDKVSVEGFEWILDFYRGSFFNRVYRDKFLYRYDDVEGDFVLTVNRVYNVIKDKFNDYPIVKSGVSLGVPFVLMYDKHLSSNVFLCDYRELYYAFQVELFFGDFGELTDDLFSKYLEYYLSKAVYFYIYSSDIYVDGGFSKKVESGLMVFDLLYYNYSVVSYYDIVFGGGRFYTYRFLYDEEYVMSKSGEFIRSGEVYSSDEYLFLLKHVFDKKSDFLFIVNLWDDFNFDILDRLDNLNYSRYDFIVGGGLVDLKEGSLYVGFSRDDVYSFVYKDELGVKQVGLSLKYNVECEFDIRSLFIKEVRVVVNFDVLRGLKDILILKLVDGRYVFSLNYDSSLREFEVYFLSDIDLLKFLSGKVLEVISCRVSYLFVESVYVYKSGVLYSGIEDANNFDKVLFLLDGGLYDYVNFKYVVDLIVNSGYSNDVKYSLFSVVLWLSKVGKIIIKNSYDYLVVSLDDVVCLDEVLELSEGDVYFDKGVFRNKLGKEVSLVELGSYGSISDLTRLEILSFVDDFLRVKDRAKYLSRIKYEGVDSDKNFIFKILSLSTFDYYTMKVSLELLKDEDFMKDESRSLFNKLDEALSSDIKVYCSCPAYLYWGFKYIGTVLDIAIEHETRKPVVRNKKIKGVVCKHLYKLLTFLLVWRSNFYKDISKFVDEA